MLPDSYHELVVIENGSMDGAEVLVAGLPERLNARFMHRKRGNKSYALNEAIETIKDGLVVMFDDDVEIASNTLTAYAHAALGSYKFFYGGPFEVVYDEPPPQWMVPHLPRSSLGWKLIEDGPDFEEMFLGYNWAAYKQDILSAGGFDLNYGPGARTGAVGQESNMQRRLLQHGLKKMYVPDATVVHYVPNVRRGPYWLLNRKYREGIEIGLGLTENSLAMGGIPGFIYRCLLASGRAAWGVIAGRPQLAIEQVLGIAKHAGILRGVNRFDTIRDTA